MNYLLEVKNLNVTIDNFEILKDISFNLPNGAFLNIIGPNGGGKSTLVKTIIALVNKTSGNIVVNTDKVGYMPQRLLLDKKFPITVKEALSVATNDKRNIKVVTKEFEIDELLNKQMRNLSGGQQQRVYLARALIDEPDLLILDEAFSALDPQFKHEFFHTIQDLNKTGITVIHVTHDMFDLNVINSYVLWIDKEVIFFGTFEKYQELVGDFGAWFHKLCFIIYPSNNDSLKYFNISCSS